jgi:hypothetical protein
MSTNFNLTIKSARRRFLLQELLVSQLLKKVLQIMESEVLLRHPNCTCPESDQSNLWHPVLYFTFRFFHQVLFAPIRATCSTFHNVVFSNLLLLPIMFKYFPWHRVLGHPRFAHFPQCETKFHTLAKTRRNCNFEHYNIYIFL